MNGAAKPPMIARPCENVAVIFGKFMVPFLGPWGSKDKKTAKSADPLSEGVTACVVIASNFKTVRFPLLTSPGGVQKCCPEGGGGEGVRGGGARPGWPG